MQIFHRTNKLNHVWCICALWLIFGEADFTQRSVETTAKCYLPKVCALIKILLYRGISSLEGTETKTSTCSHSTAMKQGKTTNSRPERKRILVMLNDYN